MGFTCTICGRFHEEEPRDIRMTHPEPVARLGDSERRKWVLASEDFCSYEEPGGATRHFARGLIQIPIVEDGSYFGYGAWIEVDTAQIERLASLWRDPDGANEAPFLGSLANELPPYVGTEGLPATLKLRDVELLPLLEVTGSHRLVDDVRDGISVARARELAGPFLHPS